MDNQKSSASQTALEKELELCTLAIHHYYSNNYDKAAAILEQSSGLGLYIPVTQATLAVMAAMLQFEPAAMETAIQRLREALDAISRFRRKTGRDIPSEVELHAELCYAECLLLRACISFLQDENLMNFIKGGIKIRNSFQIYKECEQLLRTVSMHGQTQTQFLGGLHLGIGMFNLMLSMFPTRVLRLLEFIGFSGNKATGLARLAEGAQGGSLRAPLCALALLAFHCYICIVLGTGNSDLGEAEALLAPFLQRFPQGAVFVFFAGRIEILKGNVSQAMVRFEEGVACQATCPGFQHMSFWELMWCHAYQQQWLLAFHFANLLNEQSRWSKATYMYMKGAFLNMAGDKARSCPETEEEIFRKVPALRQKLAGKSLPTEKFVVAKVKRYLDDRPSSLILPALEMMYIWNGFDVLGRQPALAEAILETVESKLKSLPSSSSPGDICLVMFLKGACLRELGESTLATHCFQHVRSQDRRLRSESDSYLIPNALWELSLLAFAAGKRDEAILLLQEARNNYRGYALESRLQFRIHSALSQFNTSTSSLS